MRTVRFYGASDDLIEVEGCPGADEFDCFTDKLLHGTFVLGGKLRVRALFDGCWGFAVR